MFLQAYDNGDSQLDSTELLKFIKQNESVVELQSYADQESNKLLRSFFFFFFFGGWGVHCITTNMI